MADWVALYPRHCAEHEGWTPGCRLCLDAHRRHDRQRMDVLPSEPLRTEADDDYVRDWIERALEEELRVGHLAAWCTGYLNRRALGIDSW